MDIRELRYFSTIVDSGSMSRAARLARISQPALTRSMRVLEQGLGAKLFVRTSKGVVATDAGKALYVRAKSILAEVTRAETELNQLSSGGSGSLTIGVLPSQAMTVLPDAAVLTMRKRPNLNLRVVEKPLADLEAGLRSGEFDFIVSLRPRDSSDRSLTYQVLFYDRPTVVVRRRHPLLESSRVGLRELAGYPWVLPPCGTERRAHIENLFSQSGHRICGSVIECHSTSFMKKIVMQSDYIGLLQNDAPTQEEQAGLLVAVEMQPRLPIRAIGVVCRAEYPLTEAAQALILEIKKASVRLGYRPKSPER